MVSVCSETSETVHEVRVTGESFILANHLSGCRSSVDKIQSAVVINLSY